MNIATWGRVCSAANRRLRLIWRFVKTSATTPSAIAAHAAHANQVLDPTFVTPCQPPWIHPMESTLRLYHSDHRREISLDRLAVTQLVSESTTVAAESIQPPINIRH